MEGKCNIFNNVNFKTTGIVHLSVLHSLQSHGATNSSLLSDYTTHCIVGDEPCENDIDEATNLYMVPTVTQKWVSMSLLCQAKLPVKPFLYNDDALFSLVTVCVSQLKRSDTLRLWGFISYHGGNFLPCLNQKVTHLIVGRPAGRKYEFLNKSGKLIRIVTPDWVTASIRAGTLLNEDDFHPRLMITEPSDCNTSFITGFADDCMISQSSHVANEELLNKLKLRMPWNVSSISDIAKSIKPSSFSFPNLSLSDTQENIDIVQKNQEFGNINLANVSVDIDKSNCVKCEMQLEKEGVAMCSSNSMEWSQGNADVKSATENMDDPSAETKTLIYSNLLKHMDELTERFKDEKMWLVFNSDTPLACSLLESLVVLEQKHINALKLYSQLMDSNLTRHFCLDDWVDFKNKLSLLYAHQLEELNSLTLYKNENHLKLKELEDPKPTALHNILPTLPEKPSNDIEMISPSRLPKRRSIVRIDTNQRAHLKSMSTDEKDTYLKGLQKQQLTDDLVNNRCGNLSPRFCNNGLSSSQNKTNLVKPAVQKARWGDHFISTAYKKTGTMKSYLNNSVGLTKFVTTPTSIPATPQKTYQYKFIRDISSEYVVHETDIEIPKDIFLIGCVFLIVNYSNSVALWTELINGFGGKCVTEYCDRITHIVAQSQMHHFVQRGYQESKRCVSGQWLSEILANQCIIPPCIALHFPFRFAEKPASYLSMSYSGFEGLERSRVKLMIEATGAKATSYYGSLSDVLVCKRAQGEKYNKAVEWNKTIVNVQWLNKMLLGVTPTLSETNSCAAYKKFDDKNPFVIDYSLVEHLMMPWKKGLKITQDDLAKALIKVPENPRVKRRKILEQPLTMM